MELNGLHGFWASRSSLPALPTGSVICPAQLFAPFGSLNADELGIQGLHCENARKYLSDQ